MIEITELLCTGLEHVPVNAGMIDMVCEAFPDEPVTVNAEGSHLAHLRVALEGCHSGQIRWVPIDIPDRWSRFDRRLRHELRVLGPRVLRRVGGPRLNILLSAHRSTLWSLKLLLSVSRTHVPTQVVLHGALSEIESLRARNPFVRMVDMKSTITACVHDRLQVIVLEEAIIDRLSKLIPRTAGHVIAVPHPLPATELFNSAVPAPDAAVRLAFLGLATPQKGFPVFSDIAHAIGRGWPGRLEFHALGSAPRGDSRRDLAGLATQPATRQLPRDEFLSRLRTMHYVCLPYQGDHYGLTASGALLDAIANTKPVIALPTPTLSRIFSTYDIGYLCQTRAEMEAVVRSIAQTFPREAYERQVENLRLLRQTRLPRALARNYSLVTSELMRSAGTYLQTSTSAGGG